MPSIFNPSGARKQSRERVVKEGKAMYAFPDAYTGRFEFFKDRPIRIGTDDSETVSVDDLKVDIQDR